MNLSALNYYNLLRVQLTKLKLRQVPPFDSLRIMRRLSKLKAICPYKTSSTDLLISIKISLQPAFDY
jgi:hypothetical protein